MTYAKKVLILFAHPALHKSRVNQVLAQQVRRIDGVTFHDLYAAYPEFDFEVPAEQALLDQPVFAAIEVKRRRGVLVYGQVHDRLLLHGPSHRAQRVVPYT